MAYFKIKMDNSPEGQKKNRRVGLLLILGILAVNVIPYWYSHSEYGMIREARSRYNCTNSRTSGYYEYLEKFPEGKYSKEATDILHSSNCLTPQESEQLWETITVTYITGEPTGKTILAKNIQITSPTGVNGGKWDAQIRKEKDELESWYIDFCPKPNMDRFKDHGNFLKLRYKEVGENTNEHTIRLEFENHKGYKFPISFNPQLNKWKENGAKVKFVGFTNDNPHAAEYVSTPNGNGRKNGTTWVCYSDPTFIIQF